MGCSSLSYLNLSYLKLSHLKSSYVKLSEAKHCGEARAAVWRGGATIPPSGFLPLGLGRSLGLFGPPSWPEKSHKKTLGIFFQAALDFDAPRPQNTSQK